jgi:23S rRNA A2030 N6-methylase RlmJ
MWVINPPWQLQEQLDETLAFLEKALSQDSFSRYTLNQHE